MKMPKRLIASLGVLMLSATPLLHASADQRDDHDRGGPQQGHYDNRGDNHGDDHRGPQDNHRGGPPRDFGPVRQTIHDHGYFGAVLRHLQVFIWSVADRCPWYYGERLDNRALGGCRITRVRMAPCGRRHCADRRGNRDRL